MAVVQKIDVIGNLTLGEGPHWDIKTKSLYFVDIFEKSIHKYTPSTGSYVKSNSGLDYVSVIIPIEGETDKYIITSGKKVVAVKWEKNLKLSTLSKITEVEEDISENRINDAKCDATGRLWFGTMALEEDRPIKPKMGSLYSVDGIKNVKKHESNITIANGIAFNKDNTKMFYIDSTKKTIDEFNFDLQSGTLSDRKILFSFEKNKVGGLPDGMTIDTEDNLWVACFLGSCVIQISSTKPEHLLRTIKMPGKQITSVAFGGEHLDELYVTSARIKFEDTNADGPNDGGVFKITGLNAKGVPMFNFKSL